MTKTLSERSNGKLPILGRDAILGAADLPTERVPVPEWGGAVLVRAERFALDAALRDAKGRIKPAEAMQRMLAMTIVDEQGALLFSEEDVAALSRKSAVVLERLFETAKRLSGIGLDEETEKNSAREGNGVSPSASRSLSDAPLQNSDE
jgi:hypothetical protein